MAPRLLPLLGMLLWSLEGTGQADEASDRLEQLRRLQSQAQALSASISTNKELLISANADVHDRLLDLNDAAEVARRLDGRESIARRRYDEAQQREDKVFRTLKDRLKSDPKVVEARAALVSAEKDLAGERERALIPLRQTRQYTQAAESLNAARSELDQARSSPATPRDKVADLSRRAMEAANAVSALERKAMQGDARYGAAEQRVREARAALGEVNRQIADLIRVDPERVDAVEQIEATRRELAAAKKEADDGRRQLGAAQKGYNQAVAVADSIRRRIELDQRQLTQVQVRAR